MYYSLTLFFIIIVTVINSDSYLYAKNSVPLRIGTLSSEAFSFFPIQQYPGESSFIRELTNPPFVAMNENWEWSCLLCESIPQEAEEQIWISDQKSFIFKAEWTIKPGLKWGDGTTITASDVKFTFEMIQQQAISKNLGRLPSIKIDLHPKDPLRFVISFQKPRYDYYQIMAISLLPSHREAEIKKLLISSQDSKKSSQYFDTLKEPGLYYGTYIVDQANQNGMLLKHNPFDDSLKNDYDAIQILFFKKESDILQQIKKSQIDLAAEGSISVAELIQTVKHENALPNFKIVQSSSAILEQLIFNLKNPFLTDQAVRKALLLSIDREQLLKENYDNFGKAAYRFQPTNDELSILMYPYNPNLAAKLLDNSGWRLNTDGKRFKNGERLSFEIVTDDYPVHVNLAKTIERLWLNLGITVQVKIVDSKEFKEDILKKRMFRDIALVAFSHVPGTYWFGRFHSRQIPESKNKFEGLNFGSWENPKMNQLISEYETSYQFDLQRRIENQIMVEIYRDLPILPLIYRPRLMIVHENVGNVTLLGHNYHASLRSADWIKIKRDRETF